MLNIKSTVMKKSFHFYGPVILFILLNIPLNITAQYLAQDAEDLMHLGNCTSIMAGKLATTDGSVITSHTCDGPYRTWVEIFPHTRYDSGAIHSVYSNVLYPHETSWDMRDIIRTGEIPEVRETYAFLNTAYPCLNEKQLAIGETTIMGRQELRNKDGIFYIEELEKIALQRCKTAREAIALIGQLAEKYGYGDYAECITFADPKEVWQFEISGSGKGKPSAIWCAARIPDDQVGVSANVPRISTIDLNNRDRFMYSTDLQTVARKLGYWDGKGPLKFWKIISAYDKAFDIREFYILSTLAPSLKLSMDSTELPFTVKPERKLSVRDVIKYFRETYEGTPYENTKDLYVNLERRDQKGNIVKERVKSAVASPWMSYDMRALLNELKPGAVNFNYSIAQNWCAYSEVIQCRSWLPDEVGAIAWFSFDNPALSPRIPIFSGVTKLPSSYAICGQNKYSENAAVWSFRETNRLATINYVKGRKVIEPAIKEFEDSEFEMVPTIEKKVVDLVKDGKNDEARQFVTTCTNNWALSSIKKWEDLKGDLWLIVSRGY
jgi:dipeptidase